MAGRMRKDGAGWLDAFKGSSLRTGFVVSLSRAMLEMLCAVADDVVWDRFCNGSTSVCPDNFIATGRSLEKRGLIMTLTQAELRELKEARWENVFEIRAKYRLTDAGRLVVQLVTMAGVYHKSDNAIQREESRRKA